MYIYVCVCIHPRRANGHHPTSHVPFCCFAPRHGDGWPFRYLAAFFFAFGAVFEPATFFAAVVVVVVVVVVGSFFAAPDAVVELKRRQP